MRPILAILGMVFLFWADLPDRWRAELAGAKPATLSGYSDGGTWRRPWRAELITEEGRTITSGDNWSFKHLGVGARTEWTQSEKVYAGGALLRWSVYLVVVPVVFALLVHDLIKLLRRTYSGSGEPFTP